MSTQVTLTLDDETYRRAQNLAQLTGRDIADVLSETLDISLQPLGAEAINAIAVSELKDVELLALADSQMEKTQDARFQELLNRQNAGKLKKIEHTELLGLMQIYQEGLLRKAQALNEAVKRGLRNPLDS